MSASAFLSSRLHVTFPRLLWALFALLFFVNSTHAIKFNLQAYRYPPQKCIWNTAHENTLVIITANVSPGEGQRVDIEIIDGSQNHNKYLSKKDINGESRFAVTTHADGDVGVCLRNYLPHDTQPNKSQGKFRVVDLDIDIGADAVDYNAIANQESLSGLETEMRKLEGVADEVVAELNYLKEREERFQTTNESTARRVQSFGWFILCCLVVLGIWQISHLRAFFKRKYLID